MKWQHGETKNKAKTDFLILLTYIKMFNFLSSTICDCTMRVLSHVTKTMSSAIQLIFVPNLEQRNRNIYEIKWVYGDKAISCTQGFGDTKFFWNDYQTVEDEWILIIMTMHSMDWWHFILSFCPKREISSFVIW